MEPFLALGTLHALGSALHFSSISAADPRQVESVTKTVSGLGGVASGVVGAVSSSVSDDS
eukprot:235934-Hanusia_phi.AAC.2